MSRIAFIGAGSMGGAIVRGVCRGTDPLDVVIYRRTGSAAAALAAETGCRAADSAGEAVRDAAFVVLAVKPQVLPGVLEELIPHLRENAERGVEQVIVSIAAAVTLDTLKEILTAGGLSLPVVRVMPNTPAAIGEGILFLSPGEGVGEPFLSALEELFSPCGTVVRTTERELDLGSALAGCGPAFVYMFIEALADGGVQIGLSRADAQTWAARTVAGAAEMVLRTGAHPGALKDGVCSPGGSTIRGVAELESRGFRAAAARAVTAAYERICELSK